MKFTDIEKSILKSFNEQVKTPENVIPYCSQSDKTLFNILNSNQTVSGITITSSGFYGPQGRSLRLKTKTEDLHIPLGSFNHQMHKISNFEMESSALFSLSKSLGHKACTICLGIANRPNFEFSKGYTKEMNRLIQYTLDSITQSLA